MGDSYGLAADHCELVGGYRATAEVISCQSGAEQGAVPDRPARPVGPPAAVEGFRQARFGMSEEQVRQAIRQDFPAAAGKLTSAVHPSEKTTVLSLVVADLQPGTGDARISYIFGYRSKKLIQINILWSSDGSSAGDETVVGTAASLRDYFALETFDLDSTVVNRRLDENTILVFRANDEQRRTVLLVLSGIPASAPAREKKGPRSAPLTLERSYIADAAHPDVFKIGKGQLFRGADHEGR